MSTGAEPGGAEMLATAADMRACDALAIARGTPGTELMARAGRAVADVAARLQPQGPVLVLCGPGNNGGDGFVAARLLKGAGRDVTVASVVPPGEMTGDAGWAAAAWTDPVLDLAEARPDLAGLVVDALFGTGLGRDLEGAVAAAVDRVNAAGVPVLAVDVPSGIDADTGLVRGTAVRATATLALAARKPGHLAGPGRAHAGRVEVADIGIPPSILREVGIRTFVNGPASWSGSWPRPSRDGHKYDRGHTISVSGGPSQTGAARLAARAALRTGSGLVTLVGSARALAVNAAHLTAIMLKVADDPDEFSDLLTDDRFNALVLGPALGVGEATRAWVAAALEADRATVIDADGLTSFSGRADELASLLREAGRDHPAVLTPHEGEFKRLLAGRDEASDTAKTIAAHPSRLDKARAAAAFFGATVVLKGAETVVAAPDGRAAVNPNGSPHLATAGTGDVLGGMIAGLLAQGMPGFEAACAAVWIHAEAANRFGRGLISEDLPELLPTILRELD